MLITVISHAIVIDGKLIPDEIFPSDCRRARARGLVGGLTIEFCRTLIEIRGTLQCDRRQSRSGTGDGGSAPCFGSTLKRFVKLVTKVVERERS